MPPVGFNRGFFTNPEVDRLIDLAAVALDRAASPALSPGARNVAEEAPYISLWYKTNVAVGQAALSGVKLLPSADFSFLRRVRRHELRTAR